MKSTKCSICGMPISSGDICYDCEFKEKQRKEQHKQLFGMKKLENSIKKYCGCCKHWKIKGVQKIGDKPTSYGKCTKLSISGFEVETTFNDDCSSEGLE